MPPDSILYVVNIFKLSTSHLLDSDSPRHAMQCLFPILLCNAVTLDLDSPYALLSA